MNITATAFLTAAYLVRRSGPATRLCFSHRRKARHHHRRAHATQRTVIGSVALNDSGDLAFVAMEAATEPPAIFTSKRIVVRQDDMIEGRTILIAAHGQLAINNAGQVAYEAWWTTDPNDFESPGKSGAGIFVDRHLAVSLPWNDPVPITLTDDARIVTRPSRPAAREPKAGPDLIDRIRIRPPKDSPVSIAPARPHSRAP